MNKKLEMLEVVDDNDNVIGIESREKIHKDELLHRVIHIWFITPKGEIIFQHRAKDKDLLPDKLDATVGGHVEIGETYEETATKECKEETGVDIVIDNLLFLTKTKNTAYFGTVDRIHRNMDVQYAYLYEGSIDELQVEEGKAEGFEAWSIEDLPNLSDLDKSKFITEILSEDRINLFNKAKNILLKQYENKK